MNKYTVKQLARISAVSVRTLHYYDEIGLLKPAEVGGNGYRYYGRGELLRLQQILLHRELGLSLDSIASLLDSSDRDRIDRLREYRQQLLQRLARHHDLIATIDRTISSLEGGGTMDEGNLYKGFSPETQAEYEEWIIHRYATGEADRESLREKVSRSRRHVEGFTRKEVSDRMQLLASLETALARHCREGTPTDAPALSALLDSHRIWVSGMWGRPCPPDAYAGLADLYETHPDFRSRYEQLAPGFADYLPTAMRAYSRTFSISAATS